MLQFIVDTQLPPQLAAFFNFKGYNAIHTTHFFQGHLLQDKQIIQIAIEQQRIIITKDNDFLDNYLLKGIPPKVLLLMLGNTKNKDLLQLFDLHLDKIINLFNENAGLVMLQPNNVIAY